MPRSNPASEPQSGPRETRRGPAGRLRPLRPDHDARCYGGAPARLPAAAHHLHSGCSCVVAAAGGSQAAAGGPGEDTQRGGGGGRAAATAADRAGATRRAAAKRREHGSDGNGGGNGGAEGTRDGGAGGGGSLQAAQRPGKGRGRVLRALAEARGSSRGGGDAGASAGGICANDGLLCTRPSDQGRFHSWTASCCRGGGDRSGDERDAGASPGHAGPDAGIGCPYQSVLRLRRGNVEGGRGRRAAGGGCSDAGTSAGRGDATDGLRGANTLRQRRSQQAPSRRSRRTTCRFRGNESVPKAEEAGQAPSRCSSPENCQHGVSVGRTQAACRLSV
mmetsp:Transcript_21304/g.50786  ORF Transcript_21304/g.50786 Transcript_21304/m.50786 type:complete len:333 (+) Transcript_21304:180-1178(+)